MTFWNDVQKNLEKATKIGIKQSSKWLEIGKLTVSLNNEKLELQRLFEEIGELIYTNRIKDVSEVPKIKELYHKVYLQKMKIKGIEDQLDFQKKVNACEKCKQTLPLGTKYCPYCSHPQSKEVDFQL